MNGIGGYSSNPPDGPTQLDIGMLPLDRVAIEPVVYVSGILLISHEFNAQRLHEFQQSVLSNTVSLLAEKMIEAEIRAGEKAEARMKNADAREDRTTAKQQADHSRKILSGFRRCQSRRETTTR